eukprot:76986_1
MNTIALFIGLSSLLCGTSLAGRGCSFTYDGVVHAIDPKTSQTFQSCIGSGGYGGGVETLTATCAKGGQVSELTEVEDCGEDCVCKSKTGYEAMCFCGEGSYAKHAPANMDNNILDVIDDKDATWMESIALNVMISVVTSLCVIALCLASYYAMRSIARQSRGRKSGNVEWQTVKCDEDEEQQRLN